MHWGDSRGPDPLFSKINTEQHLFSLSHEKVASKPASVSKNEINTPNYIRFFCIFVTANSQSPTRPPRIRLTARMHSVIRAPDQAYHATCLLFVRFSKGFVFSNTKIKQPRFSFSSWTYRFKIDYVSKFEISTPHSVGIWLLLSL